MKACLWIVGCLLLSLCCGALLSWPMQSLLSPVLDMEFRKYINYSSLLIAALLGAVLLRFGPGRGRGLRAGFGYAAPRRVFFRHMFFGWLFASLFLCGLYLALLAAGLLAFDPGRPLSGFSLLKVSLAGLVTGLAVGFLEETLFRGAFFTVADKVSGMIAAVWVTSLAYSMVHFIRFPDHLLSGSPQWDSGLWLLPQAFAHFASPEIYDHLLTLFLFGAFLGMVRHKHGHIGACVGIHAGAVMIIKLFKYHTEPVRDHDWSAWVSAYDDSGGLWISLGLGVACVCWACVCRTRSRFARAGEHR